MKPVIGIDLAPRCSAVFAILPGWSPDIGINNEFVSYSFIENKQKGKLSCSELFQMYTNASKMILDKMSAFDINPDCVAIEDYAYAANTDSITKLAELNGTVKSRIFLRYGECPNVVPSTTARKFLMGGIRGKRREDILRGMKPLKSKDQVEVFLKNRGFVFEKHDVMDAFVVGYYLFCKVNRMRCGFDPASKDELIVPMGSTRRRKKSSDK